jgi:hypothetical protein
VSALQAEIDSRDEKMGGLEAAAEQANKGVCVSTVIALGIQQVQRAACMAHGSHVNWTGAVVPLTQPPGQQL